MSWQNCAGLVACLVFGAGSVVAARAAHLEGNVWPGLAVSAVGAAAAVVTVVRGAGALVVVAAFMAGTAAGVVSAAEGYVAWQDGVVAWPMIIIWPALIGLALVRARDHRR